MKRKWTVAQTAKFKLTMKKRREAKIAKELVHDDNGRVAAEIVVRKKRKDAKVACEFCGVKYKQPYLKHQHLRRCSKNPNKGVKTNGTIGSKNGHSKENPLFAFEIAAAHTSGTVEQLLRDVAESEKLSFNALAERVGTRLSALGMR